MHFSVSWCPVVCFSNPFTRYPLFLTFIIITLTLSYQFSCHCGYFILTTIYLLWLFYTTRSCMLHYLYFCCFICCNHNNNFKKYFSVCSHYLPLPSITTMRSSQSRSLLAPCSNVIRGDCSSSPSLHSSIMSRCCRSRYIV